MNILKTLRGPLIVLFLSFLCVPLSLASQNVIELKLIKIAEMTLASENNLSIPNSTEHLSTNFVGRRGTIKGVGPLKNIIDSDAPNGWTNDDIFIRADGTGMAYVNDFTIYWNDSQGFSWRIVSSGPAVFDAAAVAKLFSGQTVQDNEYYAIFGGRFQTNHPSYQQLNNTFVLLEETTNGFTHYITKDFRHIF